MEVRSQLSGQKKWANHMTSLMTPLRISMKQQGSHRLGEKLCTLTATQVSMVHEKNCLDFFLHTLGHQFAELLDLNPNGFYPNAWNSSLQVLQGLCRTLTGLTSNFFPHILNGIEMRALGRMFKSLNCILSIFQTFWRCGHKFFTRTVLHDYLIEYAFLAKVFYASEKRSRKSSIASTKTNE
ncbi:hypothetical protein Ae201684P_009483 [Aphanomyces euteiches]|uniref:Uncharacterized protein n=1 Tax=Aphanomyces euteiches TaxID=100861 RepID=A0A6G0WL79_9STRA|nr:hypothetical protein Ae201684_014124 [Aphanomyces euteiches]KAH9096248.1 hypothetical protein Ae201684P_009483 [Aphanomyces euteiches]